MSRIVVNQAGVSRTLSTRLAAPNDLDSFARGMIETYMPKSKQDYDTYRRYMHDILCLAFIELGVYKEEELRLGKLGIHINDAKLNLQKPDLYTVELQNIEVAEVFLSYNYENDKARKLTKYTELFNVISQKLETKINYNVIGVDLSDSEWDLSLPKLPDIHRRMLGSFISNLRYIHANSKFSGYRKDHSALYGLDKFRFELDSTDLPEVFSKISKSEVTLEKLINHIEQSRENLTDEDYVSQISAGILKGKVMERPRPHPEASAGSGYQESWDKFKSIPKNTDKLPRILQLGSPKEFVEVDLPFGEVVKELRQTNHSGGYLDLIKTFLSHSDPDEHHLISLSLSESQLNKEQLEGPGRKAAIKRLGIKTERKPPTHISITPDHEQILDDLIQTIEEGTGSLTLREALLPEVSQVGDVMYTTMEEVMDMHLACPMSGVLKFYQKASQEIVINSMRRRKNRQYVLCGSGFRGVYILIAPGPQLRTESNTEFVKFISISKPLVHELSAPWLATGDHWESEWLSVDTDRLKHWARSFDRSIISSIACSERLTEPGTSIAKACREEIKRGNFHMMSLTYLENKQLTSLTNQTIRYLWIKALGDKQLTGIMSKFPQRVGSVIQSTMLQRAFASIMEIVKRPLSDFIKIGKAKQDEQTGSYDETTTGVVGKLPRLITKGEMVPISYNLNEIYWCMMYNKDRQNPAQDALGILNKILKEEEKFQKEISSRGDPESRLNYLMGTTTVDEDISHVFSEKPESHYFSRRAVQAGLNLQTVHEENVAPDYAWLTESKVNSILSKNLSEFATFKASVKSISMRVDPKDLSELDKIGSRTKAVELVSEIVDNEKLTTAFEVAMQFSGPNNKLFDVLIQIFKKGQIGGIREIIILYIKARVLFNIVEELCRLLSKSDKREILTKGKDKRLMMRGDYEEIMSRFKKGTPVQMIKNSYDMTTWAQKFIPTIFCSIYTNMLKGFPQLKNLAYFIFLKHTNKQLEYPRKLVEMWMKHPEEKHAEPWLQSAKEKFQKDGIPNFRNHSNMCQGIPHYNSTVLALSCQSLRDALFEECLIQLGQTKSIYWKTRVGSDDKGDIIGIDMSNSFGYSQYLLFEQCAMASEKLHSMELSVKSASGNVVYELNSAFMVNLETLSPTIKFSLAACDMMTTSSCASFVNESYGRVRQLRENGGSSLLCGLAHVLNRDHFKTMFRTGKGMTNDVEQIFGIDKANIPYDFGVYPYYDVDLQDIVGPEFHNYLAITSDETPLHVKQLLFTPLAKEDLDEAFPSDEDGLMKKDHFGIRQGLIKQLVGMRKRLGVDSEEVDKFFSENPFLLIRGPESPEETLKVIHAKLLTKGASEALRRTSPAIYLGRLSAFESAQAWKLRKPNGTMSVDLDVGVMEELEDEVSGTYKEFLTWGIEQAKKKKFPVLEMLNVIFPQRASYEVIKQFIGQFGPKREVTKKYSQAVRSWIVNSYNYNFSNSLKAILETSFGLSQLSSQEDVNEFRKLLGFNLKSFEGFLEECRIKHVRPMDLFFYMSKIYKSSKISKVQAFANGPSTHTLHGTLISIKRYSHLPNNEMYIDVGLEEDIITGENRQDFVMEGLKFVCNLLLMQDQEHLTGPGDILESSYIKDQTLRSWCETSIRAIRNISGFDHQTKKIIMYVACNVLPKDELKEKLLSWKTLNFTYLKKQKKVIGKNGTVSWEGELKMLVNSGKNSFVVNHDEGFSALESHRIDDYETLLQTLHDISRLLSIDIRSFFTMRNLKKGDLYLAPNTKKLLPSTSKGPQNPCLNLKTGRSIKYLRLQDLDDFKVVTSLAKNSSVSIALEQRNERSATICHFPGNYYPASAPKWLTVDSDFWFKGIRLSALFKNQDWFYNYRLPSLQDADVSDFLRKDVNFDVILNQTTSEKGRIFEYLQVNEEIDEEVFNINNSSGPFSGLHAQTVDYDSLDNLQINELFSRAMVSEEEMLPEDMLKPEGIDWAEEVEDEFNQLEFEEGMITEEDGIRYIRSFGYKRPARKANYHVISQLQIGHLLKERVLNMFFKSGAITSENRKHLPHYYIWLRCNKDGLGDGLCKELQRVVLSELTATMGATDRELKVTLDNASPTLAVGPIRAVNYLHNEQQDLFSQLSQSVFYVDERYEESEVSV